MCMFCNEDMEKRNSWYDGNRGICRLTANNDLEIKVIDESFQKGSCLEVWVSYCPRCGKKLDFKTING